MQVTEAKEGVKVYNLSIGKTLSQFLTLQQRQNKSLKKSHAFRSRIELLQDGFLPTASQKVKFTPDGKNMIAIGTFEMVDNVCARHCVVRRRHF